MDDHPGFSTSSGLRASKRILRGETSLIDRPSIAELRASKD